ncbi:hypothetical protein Tco_0911144 [Tanacetum coccineum]|uniref:Uncharacterized protein n=1 Tax=Tanacetum coccineum TaxID=301880 RepID=A0ABQ5D163_9ASTR
MNPKFLKSPTFPNEERNREFAHKSAGLFFRDKHKWKNPDFTQARRNGGRPIDLDGEPALFGDDPIPHPSGAPRPSKSQRSSNSSATSVSTKKQSTDLMKQKMAIDPTMNPADAAKIEEMKDAIRVARYWKKKAAAAGQSGTAAGHSGTAAGQSGTRAWGPNGNNFLGGFEKIADSYVRESYTREDFRKK